MTVLLEIRLFARRDDSESPKNRFLTVAALLPPLLGAATILSLPKTAPSVACCSVGSQHSIAAQSRCDTGKIYDQSQVWTHYGLTNCRAVEKIATARPPVTGTERGVSNREGDTRYLCFTTLCQESIPAALSPPFPESPVGSNTETDDDCRRRQFFIGKLSVRKPPYTIQP